MASLDVNIGHWVRKNALIYRDKIALRSGPRAFTYAQLQQRMNRLASALKAGGVGRGDRVGLYLQNSVEYVEAVFALSAMGAIAVPLNWRLGEEELRFIVDDCTACGLIFHRGFAARAAALRGRCPSLRLVVEVAEDGGASAYEDLLASGDDVDAVDPAVGGDDVHLIMYTAGTTGDPKGVMLTHANCFWQSVNGWALGVQPETVAYVILPLFHVGGLNGSVTPMIHVGATVILPPRFDVEETLRTFEQERVTGMVAVPAVYQMLYDHPRFATTDLSSIQAFISGGAPLPLPLIAQYHARGLEFRQGYGLTETSPGATGMGPGECLRKAGTAGRPCLYVDIRIAGDDDQPLPPGRSGEVLIRGPNVMKGYWNRPEQTAEALRGGWFHSGDIGFLDEDGFLTLVDRKKDMIISGGENIFPAEIERVLEQHPAVLEVSVVGAPDPKWGEVPVAFVALRPGMQTSADALLSLCRDKIARFKLPREIRFKPALPRNAAGKILKPALRQELREAGA